MTQKILSFLRRIPVTTGTTVAMIAFFAATALQAGSVANNIRGSDLAAAMELYGPLAAELPLGPLRLLSSAFMHRGADHLFANAALLLLMGGLLERSIGSRLYALIWFTCAMGASAAILQFDFYTYTVGASGVAYGVMALYALYYWRAYRKLVSPLLLIALNLGYTFLTPGVSVWAHLGGLAAGGLLVAAACVAKTRKGFVACVWLLCVAVVAWSGVNLWEFSTSVVPVR